VLGVAPSPEGNTVIQHLFRKHVKSKLLSMCFAEWGGLLSVGKLNNDSHTSRIVWVPMATKTGLYRIHIEKLLINNKLISQIGKYSVIDSGTTYTYMGTPVYTALRNAIEGYCGNHSNCTARRQNSCFVVNFAIGLRNFPNITWILHEDKVVWEARSYLFRLANSTTWCYAFQDDGPSAKITLGASWMVHKDIVFDMSHKRVGIAEANCPEYRVRPEHKETVTTPTVYELPPQHISNPVGRGWHPVYAFTFVFLAGLTFAGCRLYLRRMRTDMPQIELGVEETADVSSERIGNAYMGAPSFVIGGNDEDDDDDEEHCFIEDGGLAAAHMPTNQDE